MDPDREALVRRASDIIKEGGPGSQLIENWIRAQLAESDRRKKERFFRRAKWAAATLLTASVVIAVWLT
jgi:hypothetical protein